jgi:hypothetical protein
VAALPDIGHCNDGSHTLVVLAHGNPYHITNFGLSEFNCFNHIFNLAGIFQLKQGANYGKSTEFKDAKFN